MAESALSITYSELRREVGRFLGWSRTDSGWSATQNTDFADISKRALREFYFPSINPEVPIYEWSFLRETGTISLVTNTSSYDFPDGFSGVILDDSITWAAGQEKPPLHQIVESTLRKLQSNDSQIKGPPKYYAVRAKTHAPTTGQRYQILLYPTPSSAENALVLTYRYVYLPEPISSTNIYPAGGGLYSETILASHLAAAEIVLDGDTEGPQTQRFRTLLAQAMRNDGQQKDVDNSEKA